MTQPFFSSEGGLLAFSISAISRSKILAIVQEMNNTFNSDMDERKNRALTNILVMLGWCFNGWTWPLFRHFLAFLLRDLSTHAIYIISLNFNLLAPHHTTFEYSNHSCCRQSHMERYQDQWSQESYHESLGSYQDWNEKQSSRLIRIRVHWKRDVAIESNIHPNSHMSIYMQSSPLSTCYLACCIHDFYNIFYTKRHQGLDQKIIWSFQSIPCPLYLILFVKVFSIVG